MEVYLDNAATTPIDPQVVEAMLPYLHENYGNPSSQHAIGRTARVAIETARKTIADIIGATASEIIFTSGGTEASNIFLQGITGQVKHIISSPIEHPAVLNTIKFLAETGKTTVSWVALKADGQLDLTSLEEELTTHPQALVALMHGNNEIGSRTPLAEIARLCTASNSPFFTDTVQTIGHLPFDVKQTPVTGLSASAHKFHGPKGVGFLYLKKGTKLISTMKGGEQERAIRPGTENVAAIVGMAKALEIAHRRINEDTKHIVTLKSSLIEKLASRILGIRFNGSLNPQDSLPTILSASLPPHPQNEMLIFNLDLQHIYVSAGSACASGAAVESHVLETLGHDKNRAAIRFSFSRFNTQEEINFVADTLAAIYTGA